MKHPIREGRLMLSRRSLLISALIEHKLDVVAMLADQVIVLDHGEKIAEGPPEAVRRHEEVIRAYLGRSAAFGLRCSNFEPSIRITATLHVLKSVDYRIAAGEIVCLLGGNASGKS